MRDVESRMGCSRGDRDISMGIKELKSHSWFRKIDWNEVEQKQITPLYYPDVCF
jgi:hypothetical protein